jgi:hypothetical protein
MLLKIDIFVSPVLVVLRYWFPMPRPNAITSAAQAIATKATK